MNLDVQWFCYNAVDRGVMSAGQCEELLTTLGTDTDLISVAQNVLDSGICEDLELIQTLVDEACERSRDGEKPPFDAEETDEDTGADGVYDLSQDDDLAAAVVQPAARSAAAAKASTAMPDFAAADRLTQSQAAVLMRQLFAAARAAGASDIHLSAGAAPFLRRAGRVVPVSDVLLTAEASQNLNLALLPESDRCYFLEEQDFNFALELQNGERYRANLVVHKEGIAGTFHIVPTRIESVKALGFLDHETITKLLDYHNGLILVTGPAGSGKTTTLAALVDHLNQHQHNHIITIEDPLEVIHKSKSCFVTQREIGKHTTSYASALKAALREDPDVIVIGELHDLETIEMAITAAETGHLVIGTLHTRDAATTLNRLLDVFPPAQQPQIRAMTSESLRGVICQQLLPGTDGDTQVVAAEILVNTIAVSKIVREGRTHHLAGVMQTGQSQGMCSMDAAVLRLFQKGRITQETALANIRSKETLNRVRGGAEAEAASLGATGGLGDASKKKPGWFR